MLNMKYAMACVLTATIVVAQEKPPRSVDPRIKIELFAEQPRIVTPTGIAVDSQGRVWAIESNTHFPPAGYSRHASDRLLVMQDKDGDGRAEQIDVFADGFTHAMSVAIRKSAEAGKPDEVYVATRREIVILTDEDGDLRADRRRRIMHLETKGDYPHNGLAGFAWDAEGWMYFGFGENLGAAYKIIGSDGHSYSGGGEGGNLYRCRPDGSQLSQWATGFWNPHASCIDAHGRMFTVDNDPDSRPPCRLLHIIRDGDYGYRFSNGRKGLHPFTAWNGEIPGTLPMVAGTGEAPSGIVAYEASGLPEEYLGNLLVTSWGDHRIDRFRLKPKGASYESLAEPLIVGGENFRPVGLAVAPDGSLYCTDWVLKDYKLHGKGRVWRISSSVRPATVKLPDPSHASSDVLEARRTLSQLQHGESDNFRDALNRDDPFTFSTVVQSIAQSNERDFAQILEIVSQFYSSTAKQDEAAAPNETRLVQACLLAVRKRDPKRSKWALIGLKYPDALMRRIAAQWVAEQNLQELRPQVEGLLNQEPMTTDLFLATLAALEMLDGKKPADFDKTPAGKYVLPILADEKRPAAVRTQALRLVSPDEPALQVAMLEKLLASDDHTLKLEAVRTLQGSSRAELTALLNKVALDNTATTQMRTEAIAGLSRTIAQASPKDAETIVKLLASKQPTLVIETLRAMRRYDRANQQLRDALRNLVERLPKPDRLDPQQLEMAEEVARLLPETEWSTTIRRVREKRPADVADWLTRLDQTGDAQAGRRVFFHPLGAGCWKCHTVNGRGGAIGPDLTYIARTMNRQKLAQSILEPGKEISPQFTAWTFVMTSGQVHQGMILGDTRDGRQRIGLPEGREIELRVDEIDQREPSPLSIMPTNLIDQLTLAEFRHLLAFLETLK